jgi:UDP-GlcNAc:undecaprenyl-phosphate GlcNAc-1-phosphate transferase
MDIGIEFLVSLGVVWLLTPWMRRLACAAGCVDLPSCRKVHDAPTPLLGGVAIYLAILCGWTVSARFLPALGLHRHPAPVIMGVATALMVMGLLDDCRSLSWCFKIVLQVVAAALLYSFGIKVQLSWLPEWADLLLTLIWLVGITNAVNFLDNMNGLAAGLCAIAAAFYALLGLLFDLRLVAGVAAAVAGASFGFLRFNYRHASIFMGDAGSLLLGLLLAVAGLLLRFPGRSSWITWMSPVIVMLVPVFDMTLVCLSRLRHGRNPLATPGKDHISHRLIRLGLSQNQAVDLIYCLAVACGLAGTLVISLSAPYAYALFGLLLIVFVAGLIYLARRAPVAYPPRGASAKGQS